MNLIKIETFLKYPPPPWKLTLFPIFMVNKVNSNWDIFEKSRPPPKVNFVPNFYGQQS